MLHDDNERTNERTEKLNTKNEILRIAHTVLNEISKATEIQVYELAQLQPDHYKTKRKRERNNRNTALSRTIDSIEFTKCAPLQAQQKNWKFIDCNHCERCCANTLRYYI